MPQLFGRKAQEEQGSWHLFLFDFSWTLRTEQNFEGERSVCLARMLLGKSE